MVTRRLRALSLRPLRRHEDPDTPTVLHVTHHKAGSQWVLAVLRTVSPRRVVTPMQGVAHVLRGPLRPGHIYPTVYLSRDQLELVRVPEPQRRFVVIRDLRDTLVSLYFSLRHSHPILNARLAASRKHLRDRSLEEGLRWTLENPLRRIAALQLSWVGCTDLLLKYEDMLEDEFRAYRSIVDYCGISVADRRLRKAVKQCSFEAQSGRKRGQEDIQSHHRKGVVGDWRHYIKGELKDEFKRRYRDVLIKTGYECDYSW